MLVYAFDTSAGDKHALAKQLLARLWETERGCLSVQVLAEFFVTVTRKIKQPLGADEPPNASASSPPGRSSDQ